MPLIVMSSPRFTVFTAAFNRCETLARTYASLSAQTFLEFEWLIVDDGSVDRTSEVVNNWQQTSPFPIRYLYQRNGGKYLAHNRAVLEARGELFVVVDDDDCLVPDALERLLSHWNAISEQERPRYSGVTCLSRDQHGQLLGRPFPLDVLDCRHYELERVGASAGEKWGFHRTAVLREFPFPEISGEKYCPEGIVWNRIGRKYLMRHVNEPLRIYFLHENNLSVHIRRLLMRNPRAARLYYREFLGLELPLRLKYKKAINYIRYSLHAGGRAFELVAESGVPLFTALLALPGCVLYVADVLHYRESQGSEA
jgi:glycosyltransferase involved in cell wall biosynthesis